jgi:hypothetical protein
MKKIVCIASIVLVAVGPHGATAAEGHYTKSMFARAVKKDSSSPRYALVQVQNPQTSAVQTVARQFHRRGGGG